MGKASGTTRTSRSNNPRGLRELRGNGTPRDAVVAEIDNYYGFESDGDFLDWPVLRSFSDMNEVSDMIDNFTDYFVEDIGGRNDYANVGYGRDVRTQTTFNVLPKGTPDGDEELFRKSITVDSNTRIVDILNQLGYRSRKDNRY